MKFFLKIVICFFVCLNLWADIQVGVASFDITPPIGTPSAGYRSRRGAGMQGVKDPLLANVMVIDNKKSIVAFCSVDNLGFDRSMTSEIKDLVKDYLDDVYVFVGSTHTHSGGGAFLNYPMIGEVLAGKFDFKMRDFYINQTANAIIEALNNRQDAKVGIGYGILEDMNQYRGLLKTNILPRQTLSVIKATTLDNKPLGLIFNFACHPVTLPSENLDFSADFVGEARKNLSKKFKDTTFLFFNGAEGDVNPNSNYLRRDYKKACSEFGEKMAGKVCEVWKKITAEKDIDIDLALMSYDFDIKPTSQGIKLPFDTYCSEINLLVFNQKHAFLTVPGELSCIYDSKLRKEALKHFDELSILGLVNDAHGYILTPEAWDAKNKETVKSFGGREYGRYFFEISRQLILKE